MPFAADTSGQSAAGGLLQGFTGAYVQQKQLQQDNALRQAYLGLAQKNSQMGLLQNGMQTDSSGNVSYTPEQQGLVTAQRAHAQNLAQLQIEYDTPGSDANQNFESLMRPTLELPYGKQYASQMYPKGITVTDFENSPAGKILSDSIALKKAQVEASRFNTTLNDKQIADAQKGLNKDPDFTAGNKGLAESAIFDKAITDAQNGNQIDTSALPIMTARLTTNGQRLNQTEIKMLGGPASASEKLKNIISEVSSGKPSDNTIAFLNEFAANQKQVAEGQIAAARDRITKQHASRTGKNYDQAYLDVNGYAPGSSGGPVNPNSNIAGSGPMPTPEQAAAELAKRQKSKVAQQ